MESRIASKKNFAWTAFPETLMSNRSIASVGWTSWWCGFLISLALFVGCSASPEPRVVLYSAQDGEFAQDLLKDFTARTGLRVDRKYDTQPPKSGSLHTELRRERPGPRAEAHWTAEMLP